MPLYEYQCEACGRRSEVLQKMNEAPLTLCPHCGGALKKLFSAPSFQLKGSGWYASDYAKKPAGEKAKGESSGGDDAPDKAAKPAESAAPAAKESAPASGTGDAGGAGEAKPSTASKAS